MLLIKTALAPGPAGLQCEYCFNQHLDYEANTRLYAPVNMFKSALLNATPPVSQSAHGSERNQRLCYTEKARHRNDRQYNACDNRKKQCRPNETKPHSNAIHLAKGTVVNLCVSVPKCAFVRWAMQLLSVLHGESSKAVGDGAAGER